MYKCLNSVESNVFFMFTGETDLKCPYHSDTWLVRFLRPCKFHPESAHQLVSLSIDLTCIIILIAAIPA